MENSNREKVFIFKEGVEMCKEHKPMNKVMGYVEWHEWADLKVRRGHIQKQCKICHNWLFKCER